MREVHHPQGFLDLNEVSSRAGLGFGIGKGVGYLVHTDVLLGFCDFLQGFVRYYSMGFVFFSGLNKKAESNCIFS